ncbi:unnamed protein product [Cuscuta campestris]|uniref:Uncharacterized protein n=1 Tax=Cuscuta campestris TaxID=132261 RepID=A0A484MIY2_9ASTE|nr:unnamed protein product [Cuscuta campestris]
MDMKSRPKRPLFIPKNKVQRDVGELEKVGHGNYGAPSQIKCFFAEVPPIFWTSLKVMDDGHGYDDVLGNQWPLFLNLPWIQI